MSASKNSKLQKTRVRIKADKVNNFIGLQDKKDFIEKNLKSISLNQNKIINYFN